MFRRYIIHVVCENKLLTLVGLSFTCNTFEFEVFFFSLLISRNNKVVFFVLFVIQILMLGILVLRSIQKLEHTRLVSFVL